MNFKHALTTLVMFMCLAAKGQDIHFSQYFASPLTLNPALIGGFNGTFRVAANYRNQWYFLKSQYDHSSSGYATFSGSFDIRLLKKKLRYDQFGVGVMVFNDKAGDGGLSNMTAMVGAAYHKVLDESSRYSLALGVLAGITQRRIDFSQLLFEEQFDQNNGFVPALGNGENPTRSSFIYPDFTVGLLFRGRFAKNVSGYLGGSMFHLHKPKEYFLHQTDEDNRLNPRFLAHGGLDIGIGEYLTFTPGFMYLIQGTASEVTPGFALGYRFDKMNKMYAGMWYRVFDNDAVIAMLAYEWDGLRVGVSYDINVSDLRLASNSQGAVEVSVIYIYGQQEERKFSPVDFCPKF